MKILYAGQFDPCCVGMRQRRYLREMGIDFRVAVERVYWSEGLDADWWLDAPNGCDRQSLEDFAADSDLIVYCPVIDQHWSYDVGERVYGPEEDVFPVPLRGRRLAALFHGSVNLAEHTDEYAKRYRQAGIPTLATTLDYVLRMNAEYVPTIVEVEGRAPLREGPLEVVHATSDPRVTQSEEFYAVCRDLGIEFTKVQGKPHAECIEIKLKHNVGYDHVRGSFSINSLENAALGLVNLVGVKPHIRDWLKAEWDMRLPWPEVETMADVRRELGRLKDSKGLTREMQEMGAEWFEKNWNPRLTAERILEAYERVIG